MKKDGYFSEILSSALFCVPNQQAALSIEIAVINHSQNLSPGSFYISQRSHARERSAGIHLSVLKQVRDVDSHTQVEMNCRLDPTSSRFAYQEWSYREHRPGKPGLSPHFGRGRVTSNISGQDLALRDCTPTELHAQAYPGEQEVVPKTSLCPIFSCMLLLNTSKTQRPGCAACFSFPTTLLWENLINELANEHPTGKCHKQEWLMPQKIK